MKDVTITVKSIQEVDGQKSEVELITAGQFQFEDGLYTVIYDECEENGMEGTVTKLIIDGSKSVTLSRTGQYTSDLIIEKGNRHLCHYATPYGELIMGVSADYISNLLGSGGGKLSFKYDVDINSSLATRNEVFIDVKENERKDV